MKTSVVNWMGRQFVVVSSESGLEGTPAEQASDVFSRIGDELSSLGLSLEHGVRTRLFARGQEARKVASDERIKALAGGKRCASSSFIAPGYLDSQGIVAVDLIAMAQGDPASLKTTVEYDPPRYPPHYVRWDDLVFFSGVTSPEGDLEHQVRHLAAMLGGSLATVGATWDNVISASFFLRRDQDLDSLRSLWSPVLSAPIPYTSTTLVDGFASEGNLLEIEITAAV
jgi:enamine deaminase RidA (YjgF/YER057c/UK114 family)